MKANHAKRENTENKSMTRGTSLQTGQDLILRIDRFNLIYLTKKYNSTYYFKLI